METDQLTYQSIGMNTALKNKFKKKEKSVVVVKGKGEMVKEAIKDKLANC